MYFSVITPADDALRQAGHEMAQSAYAVHQWLWKFFPGDKMQVRDFIFRRHEHESMPRFYVVSQRPPIAFSAVWEVRTQAYSPRLLAGQHLSFQLCANPVVTKKNQAGESQRHDVVMEAKKQLLVEYGSSKDAKWKDFPKTLNKPTLYELVQRSCMNWLSARASSHGFALLDVKVDEYQQNRAEKRDIRFSTVDFSGQLTVTDPVLFQQALFGGLGHAKAFGCGLLLVKKIRSE